MKDFSYDNHKHIRKRRMKNTIKRGLEENCLNNGILGKFYYIFVMFSAFLVAAGFVGPASAERPDAADLTLQVSPSSVEVGNNVQISADVVANQPVKVGTLIYRLVGPDGDVNYLEPIIIHDFKKGDSHHTDMDYQAGNNTGDWNVEAYLCIGQCAIKGENPPRNAAATTSASFTVTESTGGTIPLEQPSGLIQFPQ